MIPKVCVDCAFRIHLKSLNKLFITKQVQNKYSQLCLGKSNKHYIDCDWPEDITHKCEIKKVRSNF